jgi:hypothetical protein
LSASATLPARAACQAGGRKSWRAAERTKLLPCVIYKYDRRDIRCVIPLGAVFECSHDYTIEMDLETFAYICREIMADA